MTSNLDIPTDSLTLEGKSVQEYFKEASGGDVELTIDDSLLSGAPHADLAEVESLDLHNELARITQNPQTPGAVNKIGLIYAGKYRPNPSLFGFMFDWGRSLSTDASDTSPFQGIPREGCAIFLNAMRAARAHYGDYRNEVAFTAIHELGHVFNLQHRKKPLSFMAQSRAERTYTAADGAFCFAEGEKKLLRQCSQSPFVCPGGSPFKDLGPLAALNFPRHNRSPLSGLQMRIGASHKEAWQFEPIELDVTIRAEWGVSERFRIPDTIDPGYSCFVIWIEDPNGEVRRFRSPRRYCWNGGHLWIAKGKPFRRDISLFVESQGYAFRQAGLHRIRVTFQISQRRWIESNEIEIYICPTPVENRKYQRLQASLTKPSHAKLLYYRRARSNQQDAKALSQLVHWMKKSPTSEMIHYVLGRAQARAAIKARQASTVKRRKAQASRHLNVAAESELLGEHRRKIAADTLDRVSQV
jgi:hypothetical protein